MKCQKCWQESKTSTSKSNQELRPVRDGKDELFFSAAAQFVGTNYAMIAADSWNTSQNQIIDLLNQRAIPREAMDELTIRSLLNKLAVMDSNNFHGITGVGEREGRIFSSLVKQKNFDLGHGIGRSGDVNALQPKAVGSSLMVKLTKAMTLNVLRKVIGLACIKDCIVLPFATGMSITLTLLALKSMKPEAEYVIWPRID